MKHGKFPPWQLALAAGVCVLMTGLAVAFATRLDTTAQAPPRLTNVAAFGVSGHDHASHSHSSANAAPRPGPGGPILHASWIRYESIDKLLEQTDAVVLARATQIHPGEPLRATLPAESRAAAEGHELPTIPTRRITIEVLSTLRGSIPEHVTLFQTGGETGRGVMSLEGDPPFSTDAKYLLFLRRRPNDGLYMYHGPDGRYKLLSGGDLDSSDPHGGVAKQLDGRSLADVSALLK